MPDYWAKDLNVNIGQNNFGEIRYEFYRDDTVELEAFKADEYDVRYESTAKLWATAYDFPAARDGRVVRDRITSYNVCYTKLLRVGHGLRFSRGA